jgi:hypothetical protein
MGSLLALEPMIKVSWHYQPITAILYTSSTTTVATAIQADSV